MLVWRYMDLKYGVQSAITGRFKLSRIQDLNDAYEMRCVCVGKLKPSVQQEFRNLMAEQYKAVPPIDEYGREKLQLEEVLNYAQKYTAEYFNLVLTERKIPEARQKILCFSDATVVDSNSDLLLWGHYGDKGAGVRVLLDIPSERNNTYAIRRVRYAELRPVLDISLFNSWMDLNVMMPFFEESVFTKGLGWAYEHEVRLLARNGTSSVIHENGMDFISFDISFVKCIDFGPLTTREETNKIVSDIRGNKELSHIKCRIAVFSDVKYQYDYVDYDEVLNTEHQVLN